MKSFLYHIQLNIDFHNFVFYEKLMKFLGWKVIVQDKNIAGFKSGTNGDIWFLPKTKDTNNHYDGKGMNHVALRVEKQSDIDDVVKFLRKNKTPSLFSTPRHREDFVSDKKQTYYQVMFTSPDDILFEMVYLGKK